MSELMTRGDCSKCVFWNHPGENYHSRESSCQIWEWIQFQYGDALDEKEPLIDKKVCPKFQNCTGIRVNCYDCKHWNKKKLVAKRKDGCTYWYRMKNDINNLQRKIRKVCGDTPFFTQFTSECPYEGNKICFDFQLNTNLEAGYGIQQAKLAKSKAEQKKNKSK